MHNKDNPWFYDQCTHAFGLKQEAHLLWTHDHSRVNWEEFVRCQVRANETYSEAKRQLTDRNRDVLMNVHSPHKWWSTLKSAVFGSCSSLPPIVSEGRWVRLICWNSVVFFQPPSLLIGKIWVPVMHFSVCPIHCRLYWRVGRRLGLCRLILVQPFTGSTIRGFSMSFALWVLEVLYCLFVTDFIKPITARYYGWLLK